jgi:glyoxylase-like metal-dependent hydrolase (beta-lactamase superfamily II)
MLRERVSDDIYVFTSELYAQVTAGAVIGLEGAVLIDTLAFPAETLEIKDFIENQLGSRVRYVINTHYHADHANGTCLFPGAEVIGHRQCRDRLDTLGRSGLARAQKQSPDLAGLSVVLPTTLLTHGPLYLHAGKKTLQLFATPGHSPDSISVLLKEDRILFAADMMMPIPHIVDGDLDDMVRSLAMVPEMGLENVVQGHGEVVLRGEIDEGVRSNLRYLDNLRKKVTAAVKRKKPREAMREITIESCGKSRIPLNGLVARLHEANVLSLYDKLTGYRKPEPPRAAIGKPAARRPASAPRARRQPSVKRAAAPGPARPASKHVRSRNPRSHRPFRRR